MSSFPVDPAHADNTSPPDSASTDQHHSEGAANGEQENDGPGKKKKGPKRRKVNHACLYCRRSHMTCDEGRPCQRCIKREIGHLCHDERRSSVKEKTPTPGSSSIPNPPVDVARALPGSSPFGSTPIAPTTMNPAWPGMGMAQGAFLYQPEALNEFSVLSDFLESLDDGSFFGQPNGVGPSLMSPTPYNSTVLGAIAQSESLTDIDLVFIEEAFERLLLDYDRVFSAMAIPACLWRRTGEIYKANREFAELVGVDGYMLRDGRLCIYELMAEDSAVNYWEKYGNVAFDSNQKAVLTSCVLRYKPSLPSSGATTPSRRSTQTPPKEEGFISCCFSFTIRRDPYGIPTLIVGNFIKC
ncbi:predicted protein [Postia placenta Mad-698-R]|nr:predicted protein [Postia placenta Mad-698-R]